ncbi:MAG: metalloregulator ArsR/SmtB family transcription factor [Firmicutes bacterium]|nr:metalloregulator ArsR/SmtB family transcription factor [Bacillota bacterium]
MDYGSTPEADTIFKALSDPVRRNLLTLLASPQYFCQSANGAMRGICVQDLARYLSLPQSTVSRHLAILMKAGLVSHARWRTWHYYAITPNSLTPAVQWLSSLSGPESRSTTSHREDWPHGSRQNSLDAWEDSSR